MDHNNYMQIFSDTIENVFQPEKTKDTLILMKQKIWKTNDLIKQYTDKTKDVERLKLNLETIKKENKHVMCNFKSVMDKSKELELNITKIKQENNELKNNIKECEVLGAADKQNIQQLTCKIKEMEDEYSAKMMEFDLQKTSFEDEIKKLEHELKILKKSEVKKNKSNVTASIDSNTIKPSTKTKSSSDIGINVSLDDIKLNTKPEVQEKNIMTDEFYHLEDDPYPLFCAKCTTHLYPLPIEQICQTMSVCPDLIEPLSPLSESGHLDENIQNKKLKYAGKNIPNKQSQHSHKNTQDKEQECSNRNVPNEESGCSDKNKTVPISKVLSSSHLPIPIDYNSVDDTHDLQFESRNSSITAQDLVNVKLKDENHIKYKTTVTDLSCNPNLMTKHSSSIRNLEKTIQLLKRKMKNQVQKTKKHLQKMTKRINKKHCCHRIATNCNVVASQVNSDLLANICKSAIEFILDNRKEVLPKKEDHESGRSTKPKKPRKCNMKKVKLKRLNNLKSESSWKVEHLHKTISLQDVQDVVSTNHEDTLPVINQLSIAETTTNQSDLSDKTFSVHSTEDRFADVESIAKVKPGNGVLTEMESVAKVQSVIDNSTILHISTDETHMNVSPNANNIVNTIESVDTSYTATEMTLSSSYNESSINCPNDNIDDTITRRSTHTQVSNNKKKSDNLLMKNLRNLKRKMNLTVRSNKQLKIETCSSNSCEFYEPVRKRRIAHTSKTPFSQSDNEKNSIHHRMGRIVESEVLVNPSLNTQTSKDCTSIKLKTDCTMSDKRITNNFVKSTSTHRLFNEKPSIKSNVFFTKTEDSFDKNNISSLVNSTAQSSSVSAANVLIDSNTINNGTTSTKTTIRTFNNCNESEISRDNILPNTTNNEESNRYALPNVSCEDSENYKVTDTVEATCDTSPRVTSHHLVVPTLKFLTNKSYDYEKDVGKDTHTEMSKKRVTEDQTLDTQIQGDHLSVNSEENCAISKDKQNTVDYIGIDADRRSVKEDLHSSSLKKKNIENYINDDKTRKSHDKINIETEKKEICVNNKETRILHLEMSECTEKSIEITHVDNDDDDNDDNLKNERVSDIRDNDMNIDIKNDDVKDNDSDTNNDIKNDDVKDNDGDMNNDIKNNVKDNDNDTNNDIINNDVKDNDGNMNNDIKNNDVDDGVMNNDIKSDDDRDDDIDTNNDIKIDIKNDVKDNNSETSSDIKNADVKDDNGNVNNTDEDVDKILTPKDQLFKYIENNIKRGVKRFIYKKRKKARSTTECAGTFVTKQLTRLMKSNWQDCVHDDVVEKLHSICGPRIIAKYIIEFLTQYCNNNRIDMDNSFTPPAPVMSRCEQKIIMLLIDLERLKPTVIAFIRAGIQYNLFKLSNKLKASEVEIFTRIYVALARLQNDREAVRIMCCDALYCMGFRAINVLYMALTSWPEIFPHVNDYKGLLPKCMAFLILQQNDTAYMKLSSLKMLITKHYLYSQEMKLDDIIDELMTALAETPQDGLEMAIILVAKRNGPDWAYKNIIKTPLLPMIIFRKYPCMYSAFSLLGKLMRSFPVTPLDVNVKNISKQLSDLLASGEFSDNEQEGMASALLNLSRQEFDEVTTAVIKWEPKSSLRPSTIAQIEALIWSHTPAFWKTYVNRKKFVKKNS
ncbi:uncharacterized protein MAL13P1.304-like isoform X2 [Odontomachus brunneus]|uniref:uncharacterized protein MAL13P1.304-like isoform X2 n=1 Tax=Odontomachus brunneus TaxID=486640 RepID=UPI0013F1A708|nr:uncharacterized protein MAL13P1.304-like isoform X2 [Odontomachus brunneus]